MNRMLKVLSIFILSTLFLLGCGNNDEEFESFTLQELGMLPLEDTETPTLYIVNADEAENQVTIFKNEVIDIGYSSVQEVYEIDNILVTEDEITIEYNGQVETFTRLSGTVAENDDKVQYQYTDLTEPIE